MNLKVIFLLKGAVEESISECEGKHVQQVVFSTYHKALTQICFGCKKIRTSLNEDDVNVAISEPEVKNEG